MKKLARSHMHRPKVEKDCDDMACMCKKCYEKVKNLV